MIFRTVMLKVLVGVLVCVSCSFLLAGDASLSVHVIDDKGIDISDASVNAHWLETGHMWGGGKNLSAKGKTDADGNVKLSVSGVPGVGAIKDGFYANGVSHDEITKQFTNPVLAMNHASVTITLQKKIQPHPMFVRKIDSKKGRIPKIGEICGFDLVVGDWISPYGEGQVSDLTILMKYEVRGYRDYDYRGEAKFPNDGDGMILSAAPYRPRLNELRLPREAPESGYTSSLIWNIIEGHSIPQFAVKGEPPSPWQIGREYDNDNFIFRIRTHRDKNGLITDGIYGKIHGSFLLDIGYTNQIHKPGDEKPTMEFLYYLNPDSSRNLEWDTVNNLAGPDPKRSIPKEP